MKFIVLNGSPKGDLSVTMQSVKFIQKKYPRHELKIVDIASRIKKLESDEAAFSEVIEDVRSSDGVLWGFPLYVMLVSSQYKRFIELIWERNATEAFRDKYAAALSTSIHFFDHTAHNYIRGICDDLDMRFAGAFSPDMFDLMKPLERERLLAFAGYFFEAVENGYPSAKKYPPLAPHAFSYAPGPVVKSADAKGKKILVLTDSVDEGANLGKMIKRFASLFPGGVEVANICDVGMKGGCLGCCECGFDNRCVYTDMDEYIGFYNEKVRATDAIVMAGAMRDRYLSARWKQFFDRAFFNTHTPTLIGKQLAFLITGPLGQVPNLADILESYVEFQKANLAGIVTDECGDSSKLDALLENLARILAEYMEKSYIGTPSFRGVGGMKVFRDDVWGRLRFLFQADHDFYGKNGYYDFPQDDEKTKMFNEKMMAMTKDPGMREKVRKMAKKEMVKPHQHIVETK